MLKKLLISTILIFSSLGLLISCSILNNNEKESNKSEAVVSGHKKTLKAEENKNQDRDKAGQEKDNDNFNSYDVEGLERYFDENKSFFTNNNKKIIYNGYCEYGHTLEEASINKKDYKVLYNGKMTDGYGEDERGERKFNVSYNFKLDKGGTPMAYERVNNSDYMAKNKDTLNSIIKNYIVLWEKPEEGKSWEQKVIYRNKEYSAKTTMKNVSVDQYTLSTYISDIEGFYKNTYKEERLYKRGKGLISFSNTPCYENQSDNSSDLIFGYNINYEYNE